MENYWEQTESEKLSKYAIKHLKHCLSFLLFLLVIGKKLWSFLISCPSPRGLT